MPRSPVVLFALVGGAALAAACSSSNNTSTATSGTGGKTSTSSTGTGKTSTSSTGTGGKTSTSSHTSSAGTGGTATSSSAGTGGTATSSSAGTGGAGTICKEMCFTNNMAAAVVFEGYELKECACAGATAPCASQCTAECANPSTLTQNSPCGTCLLAEAAKGTGSTCTVTAGFSDCNPDPKCAPFLSCELGCP